MRGRALLIGFAAGWAVGTGRAQKWIEQAKSRMQSDQGDGEPWTSTAATSSPASPSTTSTSTTSTSPASASTASPSSTAGGDTGSTDSTASREPAEGGRSEVEGGGSA